MELKKGERFSKFYCWYEVIDNIIEVKESYAFIEGHSDDGLKMFFIFEKKNGAWETFLSSPSKDAMERMFATIEL